MLALIRPGLLGLGSAIRRYIPGLLRSVVRKVKKPSLFRKIVGKQSLLGRIFSPLVSKLRSWIKPILLSIPIVGSLFAYHYKREADELKQIEKDFAVDRSQEEIKQHHLRLMKNQDFCFMGEKSDKAKPVFIVALGTRQELNDKDAGLLKVVEHIRKNHDANILIIKAPHAFSSLKHLLCISDDADHNTKVRTSLNRHIIEDLLNSRGLFQGIKTKSIFPISYSWGAGMICSLRKQGLFRDMKIPIKGTVTVDAIQSGLENMGEGLDEICSGSEPNLNIHQNETMYGVNGKYVRGLKANDEDCTIEGSDHSQVDDSPWVVNKICCFVDSIINKTSG